jgi:ERCC4-type nuclease
MLLKIDVREQELFSKCASLIEIDPKYKGIQLISENLPLGDVIINDGTNDAIIVERKTISDLDASIKDGRYEEQSFRLNGLQHHNHNIIYLIEGDVRTVNTFRIRSIDKNMIYSAMFSINHFKGFSIHRSFNIDETAVILCNMAYKLVKDLKIGKIPYYSTMPITEPTNSSFAMDVDNNNDEHIPVTTAAAKDYCSVVKKVKKENITEENLSELMLSVIPGVSSTTALAIFAQFKTLTNLILSVIEDENCLNNISTVDANGKSRKISKTTIAKIVSFCKKRY